MSKHRLLLPVLGFFVLAVIGFFLTPRGQRVLRPNYQARATFEIRPLPASISPASPADYMKSRSFLGNVVRELGLARKWRVAEERAINLLDAAMSVEAISGTSLWAVKVAHPDEEDALNITRTATADFSQYRRELARRASERVLAELNRQVQAQEQKVAERRARFMKLQLLHEAMRVEPKDGALPGVHRGGRPLSWRRLMDDENRPVFPKVIR